MDLRNVGILPHHYTVSQPTRILIFTAVKTSKFRIRNAPSSAGVLL
jgi:hypothetical protein